MKPSSGQYIVAASLALLMLAALALAAPAAQAGDSCRPSKDARDCSLCCALGGFNKFDSQQFQRGNGCKCYTDERELATNARHKARKP